MNLRHQLLMWLWKPKKKIRFLHHFLQLIVRLIDKFFEDNLQERAQSLAYTTLLSIVPLLAVSFSVLKSFDIHQRLVPYLQEVFNFLGDEKVGDVVISMVENVDVSVLGGTGLVVLFYTVVSMISTIESAFNRIWGIYQGRTFWRRVTNYLVVVMIGPVLAFAILSVTSSGWVLMVLNGLSLPVSGENAPVWLGKMTTILGFLISKGLTLSVLTACIGLAYLCIPNRKVRLIPALIGALIASVTWYFLGGMFAQFVVTSSKYSGIYSGFASVILFVLWMYFSWLIILLGAQITYFIQNPESIQKSVENVRAKEVVLKISLAILDDKNKDWSVKNIETETIR